MSDTVPEGPRPDEGEGAGPKPREDVDAATETAREEAAATAQQQYQQVKREEGAARRRDSTFAHVLIRFLQRDTNDAYLEILVSLLDRNVPSSLLLATVGLIDDEAAHASVAELADPNGDAQRLAPLVDTHLATLPPTIPNAPRVRSWLILILATAEALDADFRARLTTENREADTWLRDLFQATLLRTMQTPTKQARVDAAMLATQILHLVHQRPIRKPGAGSR